MATQKENPAGAGLTAGLGAAAALGALAPTQAQAGAWLAADEETILTQTIGQRDDRAYYETGLYYEHAFDERMALIASPWARSDETDHGQRWRGEAQVALKAEVYRSDRAAMALQGGAVWASQDEPGCGEAGLELGWSGGVSFGEKGAGFANIDAAARLAEGGCAGERLDITAGYRPDRHWLGMAQVFVDEVRFGEAGVKAQLSVARFGDDGAGLQVGVRAGLDGDAEPALMIGLWRRR